METHGTFLAKEIIYLLTGDNPSFDININNFTMMPSYSSADLRFPTKDLYLNWKEKDLCGHTPFDFVYAPTSNEEHVSVSNNGSIWFESEVRCAKEDLPTLVSPLNGPSGFCTSGNFSITFCKPGNHTVNWTVSDPNVATISSSGNAITLTRKRNGSIILTASITYPCLINGLHLETILTKTIQVGQAKPASISWAWDIPPKRVTLSTDGADAATSYQWYSNGVLKATTTEPYYALPMAGNVSCGNFYYFGVKAVGLCGVSDETYVGDYMPPCYFGYKISPNPAFNTINIQTLNEDHKMNVQKAEGIQKIEIYDKMGAIRFQKVFALAQWNTSISVTALPNDIYTLRIFNGNNWQSTKVIVQH